MRRQKILSVREQKAYIQCLWRALDCRITSGLLVCQGKVRPLPICSEYSVRIEYRVGKNPKVWVKGLPARNEEPPERKIPHRYADGSICLFYGREWTPDKPIARTIFPWLLEWLMYYEGWLATGEWQGGGTHSQPMTFPDGETSETRALQPAEDSPTDIAIGLHPVSASSTPASKQITLATKSIGQ
jgi:hypothetical protein